MAVTYALGNWTVNNKQDKAIKRIFNKMNADRARAAIVTSGGTGYSVGNVLTLVEGTFTTAATFVVTGVVAGVVTAVALVEGVNAGGVYSAHPTQNLHTTTVAPAGGTGCTLTISFFPDIPGLVTKNSGILDNAVTSWGSAQDAEVVSAFAAAIPSATDPQLAAAAAAIPGIVLPV